MVGSAFDLLQLINELALFLLVFICLEFFQRLVLLEGGDILSQLIDKRRCPMLDKVVNHDQHIQISACLLEIVLENSYPFDHDFYYLLEGL